MAVPLTIQAASIGIPDTLLLMLLALVVFGPRRLPEIGRQIGKLMYEFRKVSNDFKYQMEEELRASEEADRQRKIQAALPAPAAPVTPPIPAAVEALEQAPDAEASAPAPAIPEIHPPSTGEPIAAARPFRTQGGVIEGETSAEISAPEETTAGIVPELGQEAHHA